MVVELINTLSNKKSLISSKRIERCIFTTTVICSVISCIIYEIVQDKLTALEVTILTGPLLIAAGFNMNHTQKEKQNNGEN